MKRAIIQRIISLVLILVIIVSSLSGCSTDNNLSGGEYEEGIDTEQIADIITAAIREEVDSQQPSNNPMNEIMESAEQMQSSADIDSDRIETFVYGLIAKELEQSYDIFSAVIYLDSCTNVYGIGYTDYALSMRNESGDSVYFPAGFIAYSGDFEIPEEKFDDGLIVYRQDYWNEKYSFVYAYRPTIQTQHCVFDGYYLKYGTDENGTITYSKEKFEKGCYDASLGDLYSYDEERYIYKTDINSDVKIAAVPLYESIDYDQLQEEINRVLEEQDLNFERVTREIYDYYEPEMITSYLLSLQDETFLGYDVESLVSIIDNLPPEECIRVTPDGCLFIEVDPQVPQGEEAVAKWIIGICTGVIVISSIVLDRIPALRPLTGAVSGAATEIFAQVVFENHLIKDICWQKVLVASAAGAIMSTLCPLALDKIGKTLADKGVTATLTKLAEYGFLTLSGSLIAGITNVAYTAIDGNDNYLEAFASAAAMSAAFTVVSCALVEVTSAVVKALKKTKLAQFFKDLRNKKSVKLVNDEIVSCPGDVEDVKEKALYHAAKETSEEISNEVSDLSVKNHNGGKYTDVKRGSDSSKYEVNHMPADSVTDLPRGNGPSIKMEIADHRKTASWGNSKETQAYLSRQKELCDAGKYHEAIQMDIDDICEKFGNKYEDAISEMIEYAKSIGWW